MTNKMRSRLVLAFVAAGAAALREPGETRPVLWHAVVNGAAGSHLMPFRVRAIIYRLMRLDVAIGCNIRPGVVFRTSDVRIGRGTSVNGRCVFDNRATVTIGKRCGIGIGVTFITSTHDLSDPECRAGRGSLKPITVGDGVWIGSSVTVLPGVTIGDGCVVAAGSVVSRDCAAHSLYAGVPARLLRDL